LAGLSSFYSSMAVACPPAALVPWELKRQVVRHTLIGQEHRECALAAFCAVGNEIGTAGLPSNSTAGGRSDSVDAIVPEGKKL
jgi:hypothetical protein